MDDGCKCPALSLAATPGLIAGKRFALLTVGGCHPLPSAGGLRQERSCQPYCKGGGRLGQRRLKRGCCWSPLIWP